MRRKAILPPTWFLLSILVMVVLHFGFPLSKIIPFPWNLLGIVPLFIGVLLNLVADRDFKKHATTVKPFEESTALVTRGAFCISRNPMYLGMVLILVGIAMLLGSLTPYVVVLFFGILMDRKFIKVEEHMLEEKFGDAWRAYRRKLRRWI